MYPLDPLSFFPPPSRCMRLYLLSTNLWQNSKIFGPTNSLILFASLVVQRAVRHFLSLFTQNRSRDHTANIKVYYVRNCNVEYGNEPQRWSLKTQFCPVCIARCEHWRPFSWCWKIRALLLVFPIRFHRPSHWLILALRHSVEYYNCQGTFLTVFFCWFCLSFIRSLAKYNVMSVKTCRIRREEDRV